VLLRRLSILACVALAGCGLGGGGGVPVFDVPLPIDFPFFDFKPSLDGQWVLAGADGTRQCLVIQEGRVSILDISCSSDGRGAVARIVDAPEIGDAEDTIVLTVTYLPKLFDQSAFQLIFVGDRPTDGGDAFIGVRRIIALDADEDDSPTDAPTGSPETTAVLTRAAS